MTNYNDGKWHGWNGGECPVHPETLVHYATESGARNERLAANIIWRDGTCHPVVAFRVTKEHKPTREFWVFTNGHGDLCVSETLRWDAIHVREVTQ